LGAAALVVACLGIGGCAGAGGKGASGGGAGVGSHPLLRQVAPDTELALEQGGNWRPGNASGKVLVIDFWATWCGPCKESFPRIDAIYKKLGGGGLDVVAINEDEDSKGIPGFVQSTGVSFPIALDPSGNAASVFNVGTMPSEFVVDRKGVVRYVHAGYHPEEMDAIEDEVKELLKEPP
jgi:thiol-disulfide isomerase/thioredoxin